METLFSAANVIAFFSAIFTAWRAVTIYRSQKEIDVEFEKGEIKRTAVKDYLCSIESLINHAAYNKGEGGFNEAMEILNCKKDLNKIYVYAPANVVAAMDHLLSEAIVLAQIISKIPNSKINDEDQIPKYVDESTLVNEAYTEAVNIARQELGLHHEKVQAIQLLLLGKHG